MSKRKITDSYGAEEFSDDFDELRTSAGAQLEKFANEIVEGGQEAYEALKDAGENIADTLSVEIASVERHMRDRPFACALAAFGLGVCLGSLLRRRPAR